ncbi:MAG: HAD family phosphatase [Eubacteriaceae bacterium]|nr:HAD family phosphatase [Eubacteriaceae bacterium]
MKAVIFDMDGTLLDSMHVWREFRHRVVKRLNIKTVPENLFDILKDMSIEESAEYFSSLSKNKTKQEVLDIYYEILKDFYANEAELKPNVKEFLQLLSDKNIIMCVATETDMIFAEAALKRNDILKYFDFLICAKEVGKGKKFPDIFLEALKRLCLNKEDVIIFEDSYYAAKTAKDAGFTVYAIHDDYHSNPQEIIDISDKYSMDYIDYINML